MNMDEPATLGQITALKTSLSEEPVDYDVWNLLEKLTAQEAHTVINVLRSNNKKSKWNNTPMGKVMTSITISQREALHGLIYSSPDGKDIKKKILAKYGVRLIELMSLGQASETLTFLIARKDREKQLHIPAAA